MKFVNNFVVVAKETIVLNTDDVCIVCVCVCARERNHYLVLKEYIYYKLVNAFHRIKS